MSLLLTKKLVFKLSLENPNRIKDIGTSLRERRKKHSELTTTTQIETQKYVG
jgi:hypothetical protein